MHANSTEIPGYAYGMPGIGVATATLHDLRQLKLAAGFTAEDERYLRMAGAVLEDQVERIVQHWRAGIIAGIPHLAKHSRNLDGSPNPDYLARSNRRFEQWILDTCLRPYDQDWLNYQQEIALRHTRLKKNQTDHVDSTPHVPYGDIIAFVHLACCISMHIQMALWATPYMKAELSNNHSA